MARVPYIEPSDYIPEEIRRKNKVGEFAEDQETERPDTEKENKKIRDFVNGKKSK